MKFPIATTSAAPPSSGPRGVLPEVIRTRATCSPPLKLTPRNDRPRSQGSAVKRPKLAPAAWKKKQAGDPLLPLIRAMDALWNDHLWRLLQSEGEAAPPSRVLSMLSETPDGAAPPSIGAMNRVIDSSLALYEVGDDRLSSLCLVVDAARRRVCSSCKAAVRRPDRPMKVTPLAMWEAL